MVKINSVVKGGKYFHVRFRRPGIFEEIRVPKWAEDIADSVSKNSIVRMGRTEKDNWYIQSILITVSYHDKRDARKFAKRIQEKIEND